MSLPQPRAGGANQVLCGGRTGLGIDSCRRSRRGKRHREHLGRRFAAFREQAPPRYRNAGVLQRARSDL